MYNLLVIEADYNDGDYVTEMSEVSDETLAILEPIIKIVKSKRGKWPECDGLNKILEYYAGELTEDQIETFSSYVPWNEYGVHSIKSITVLKVAEKIVYK